MERTFHYFRYHHALLHYSVYGNGTNPIFCFHGFGLTGQLFYPLEECLSEEYTFYNFDLFYHGKSEWKDGKNPLSESFLAALVQEFCKEKNITGFSLLDYSIGAKIGWSLTNSFPDKVKEIIAIAPDGIPTYFWYTLATHSALSRAVFRLLLSSSTYIGTFLKIGCWLKIVPPVTARFAESQLATEEQRQRVYKTWIVYRKLKTSPGKLIKNINQHKISLTIYLGVHDKIISYNRIKKVVEKINKKNVVSLQAGHSNLVNKVVDYLSSS